MNNKMRVQILREALKELRRGHSICEDGFYSCPKSNDYCGPEEGGECNCGADDDNSLIDLVLENTK